MSDKDNRELIAEIHTDNVYSAALTISDVLDNDAGINTLVDQVDKLADSVISGNSKKVQGALITQSKVLSVVFNRFISKAVKTNTIDGMKVYMDIALRAQNQCRKTLLALDAIQNPLQQQLIVKQQNVAFNQQVNNPLEKINSANELICENNHASLDIGSTFQTVTIDQKAETMVAIDRPENNGR